jgi:UDP-N-acetylmuramoyl-tripeptide--D-alanyl-D-alanine ligase
LTSISLHELASIFGGTTHGSDSNVTGFATDSREVKPGDCFIAIRGERVDGHDFAQEVIANGASVVLAERPVDAPHILVDNVVGALAQLGAHYRAMYAGPVIGITGSAGKTTTKEFLASALAPLGKIVKTEGNRNTEYTAPLLWPEVTPDTKAVVIEMAMRGFGQIAHLASFSLPTVGVVTNIGWSHASEVGSREGIARAKGELLEALPPDGIAILPVDDDFFPTLKDRCGSRQVFTFGGSDAADCRIIQAATEDWDGSTVSGFFADIPWLAHVPWLGSHLASNIAASVCTAVALGISPQEAADALADAELPPMRMEVREWQGAKVLLDAYNASPSSMIGAIKTFRELPCEGRRVVILGQMNELGDETERAHAQIADLVRDSDFDRVFVYGDVSRNYGLGEPASSIEELRSSISDLTVGDAILIKGSRSLELEKVLL